MELKMKDYYNYNGDGEVRAEIAFRRTDGVKESGIIPLGAFAKMLGVSLVDSLSWKKTDLYGLLLNAKYVNDEGQKCDDECTPLEDENFEILPGRNCLQWEENLWVRRDGESALIWEEYSKLSPGDKSAYRCVCCMKVDVQSPFGAFYGAAQFYVCEEAAELLPEMLAKDILSGDTIIERYVHECKRDLSFATQYGYALNRALADLESQREDEHIKRAIVHNIIDSCCNKSAMRRALDLSPRTVDDDGNDDQRSEEDALMEKGADENTLTEVTADDLVKEVDEMPYQGDNVAGH